MSVARVALTLPGSVHEAERLWYDTGRWPSWVDGLAEVTAVDPGWPHAGASVTWSSGPAGRGRVVERVVEHEPLAGQELEVEDDSLRGRQRITFTPLDVAVEIGLSLDYTLKQRSIFIPVLDALFIRRAIATSLRATLHRFGVELAADRRAEVDD